MVSLQQTSFLSCNWHLIASTLYSHI